MTQYEMKQTYTELVKLEKDMRNKKINHEDTIAYLISVVKDLVMNEYKKGE